MAPDFVITGSLLVAHFECSTKARMAISSAAPTDEDPITELLRVQLPVARAAVERFSGANFLVQSHPRSNPPHGLFDSSFAAIPLAEFDAVLSRAQRAPKSNNISPVYFSPFNLPLKWHSTILYFAALALVKTSGFLPARGIIVYGDGSRTTTVKLNKLDRNFTVIKLAASSMQSSEQAPAVNKNCATCRFMSACRAVAIDNDDLRLITSMSDKERNKLAARGVTTIAQLALTYRPRRKRREHATPHPNSPIDVTKHDPRLRALAIQKKQAHAVLPSRVPISGTPIYIDVEGIPGDETYYLIGMRYQHRNKSIEISFWANNAQDEEKIWRQFLQQLSSIAEPRLVHYGNYENTYISRMQQRYPLAINDFPGLTAAISETTNIVKSMYGKIYFPTHTNGLKDVARHLDFRWSKPGMSGAASHAIRLQWQITQAQCDKRRLIAYNIEDCRAAEVVAAAINNICSGQSYLGGNSKAVDVESLKVAFSRTYGPFVGASEDFHIINKAAYWGYQRERVYIRSPGRSSKRQPRHRQKSKQWPPRPDKVIYIDRLPPEQCLRCSSKKIRKAGCQEQTTLDIVISRKGARRQILKTQLQRYRCVDCGEEFGAPKQESRITANIRAYVVYLMIELRLSNTKIAEHLEEVYGISLASSRVHAIKSDMARKLTPVYRRIIERLRHGPVVYVDETKGVVYGGGHYVWVFASSDTTAFAYSAGRSSEVLTETLGSYSGVLVSDFYGAYEAMDCKQQKCLIHLMRDINESMIKAPFNQELGQIGSDFGVLLRKIVETIDRRGLKSRFLRRHKQDVNKFYASLNTRAMSSDVAKTLKKRFVKNRDQLFVFLEHDDVSWNNNNAEHALRAFTRLRNSMATSTAKGTQEYAVLLSVQQTLKYREMNFLGFLRSGPSGWDEFP